MPAPLCACEMISMCQNFPMKPRTLVATVMSLMFGLCSCLSQTDTMPKEGDKAPLVEGKNQDGKTWKLSKEIGKKIVLLYFYPKDNTKGCTTEACGFRDRMGDLKKQNVDVIGVSFDTPESHLKFIADYQLNFPLIADTDGKIAEAYGVKMPNKSMDRRVSFLIGKDGKIVHVTNSSNPAIHFGEMQDAINKLSKS